MRLPPAHSGAHAIGLIFHAGSPRLVSHDMARSIVDALPAFITPVALFVDARPEDIERVIATVKPQLLQFHGDESPEFCSRFALPYIKAIKVRPGVDLLQYARHYRTAKGLLLDAFVDGSHGGTGSTFDWALIPDQLPCRSFLQAACIRTMWPKRFVAFARGRSMSAAASRRQKA
jgi:phosphoribosylanthranilate isomerase